MAQKSWLEKLGVKSAKGGSRTGSDAEAEAHKSAPGANTGQSGGEFNGSPAKAIDVVLVEVVVGREDQDQIRFDAAIPASGEPVKLLENCFQLRVLGFRGRS